MHVHHYRYFTLIELLLVCAIMAILCTLLQSAIVKARSNAMSRHCCSNLHQLSIGMLSYADDYNGTLPPYSSATAKTNHPGLCWPKWLFPYIGDTAVLRCPAGKTPPFQPTDDGFRSYDGSYGWNYDGTQGNRGPLTIHIASPSSGYLILDSGDPCIIYGANNWDNLMEELDLDWDSGNEGCNRHQTKTNVAFVDAHSESRSLDKLLSAPCPSYQPPWYFPWEGGLLEKYEVPFPERH